MTPFEWIVSQAHGVQRRAKNLAREPLYTLAQQLRSTLPQADPSVMSGGDEQAKRQYLEEMLGVLGAGSLKPFGKFLKDEGTAVGNHYFRGATVNDVDSPNSPVEFWSRNPYVSLGYASGIDEGVGGSFDVGSAMRVADVVGDPARKLKIQAIKENPDMAPSWNSFKTPITALRRLGYLDKARARESYDLQKASGVERPAIPANTDNLARMLAKSDRFDALDIRGIRDTMLGPETYFDRGFGPAHNAELDHLPDWFKDKEHTSDWMNEYFKEGADIMINKRNAKSPMLEDLIEIDRRK